MGRASQERMLGKTYEERVKAAQSFSIGRFIKRVLRLNKTTPKHYANINRDGKLEVNPKLMKSQDTSDKRIKEGEA